MPKNIKAKALLAFPCDADLLVVGKSRLRTSIKEAYGYSNDFAVDLEDCVCRAHSNGDGITQFRKANFSIFVIPGPRVSSCTFGGSDYDQVYITLASCGLSNAQMQASPLTSLIL